MISLAIPTWNRSDLTIESFEQVVENPLIGEIVIVDDFSDSDIFVNLWNLIDTFHSDKIKLHRNNSNIGPLANKYETVKKCENKWCILLDSDNIIANDYIEIVSKLNKKEDILYMPETLFGMDKKEEKEEKFLGFISGQIRVLVTKPKIGAWGLNFQHCSHVTFFPSHSFEQYYQGVRRCWRFGQQRPVKVDIITTEGEQSVMENLQRKAIAADKMFSNLVHEMRSAMRIERGVNFTAEENMPTWINPRNVVV